MRTINLPIIETESLEDIKSNVQDVDASNEAIEKWCETTAAEIYRRHADGGEFIVKTSLRTRSVTLNFSDEPECEPSQALWDAIFAA